MTKLSFLTAMFLLAMLSSCVPSMHPVLCENSAGAGTPGNTADLHGPVAAQVSIRRPKTAHYCTSGTEDEPSGTLPS